MSAPPSGERPARRPGATVWRWFFPERAEPPPELLALLARVYPTLDLSAVTFHRGFPHLLRGLRHSGITLPATLSLRRARIYVHPRAWDPESRGGRSLLLHEAFHALQMQESGRGPGLLRPFIPLYLAHAAACRFRYRGHPMEAAAYAVAGAPESRYECGGEEGCGEVETSGPGVLASLAAALPAGGRLLAVPWLALWGLAAALLWLAALAVEAAGALAAGLVWLAAAPAALARKLRP